MTTQMCINRLPLCRDVQEIIKSYAFYDMKTAETMNYIKNKKMEIVTMFENSAHSRKNNQEEDPEEDSEHWAFYAGGFENQFQASNCSKCGNYSPEHAYDYMPQNILCSCGYFEDADYHPNQEPEENDNTSQYEDDFYDGDEPDIDRYEYFEQYYNDSDLEEELEPGQELEEQEDRITRTRIQAIQEQKEWDSETEENPIELMRRRQIRRMAELEGEDYYYRYFRHLP